MACLIYSVSDKEFLELIRLSSSIKEVLSRLGYNNVGGGAHELFTQRCNELNIDWKQELRNKSYRREERTIENVFCLNTTASQTTVRSWFLKGNFVPYECSICGIKEWNGKEITLRLDHINGNHRDNRLENLRWLCPNCDSQQDTFCGRNLKNKAHQEKNFCVDCGKQISSEKGVTRCIQCWGKKNRKVERPDKETLLEELQKYSFVEIGRKYKVTDNAVRGWCRSYGLSDKSSDYRVKNKKDKKVFNPETNKSCTAYTKNNKKIRSFENIREAAEWTFNNSNATTMNGIDTHIKEVCQGKRKSAYGYYWSYN